jgi:hypothetical protein
MFIGSHGIAIVLPLIVRGNADAARGDVLGLPGCEEGEKKGGKRKVGIGQVVHLVRAVTRREEREGFRRGRILNFLIFRS